MSTAKNQVQLIEEARVLADRMWDGSGQVKRNTLLTLVAEFMASPRAELGRLVTTLELLKEDNGGHLQRQGKFPAQAWVAIAVLSEELKGSDRPVGEVKTLLGWTARRLQVRENLGGPRPDQRRSEGTRTGPRPPRPGSRQPKAETKGFNVFQGLLPDASRETEEKSEPISLERVKKVSVTVLEKVAKGHRVWVELTGQELTVRFNLALNPGDTRKIKIMKLAKDGVTILDAGPG